MPAPLIDSIPNYDKYFLLHLMKLFGLSDDGLIAIELEYKLKEFFKIDDIIYLSIEVPVEDSESVTYYYQQENGSIENVKSIPEKPVQGWSVYKSNNFELIQDDYEGQAISKIFNTYFKGSATFIKINGCYETKNGLIFNVLESILPGKPAGLYFFPINRTSVSKFMENGEVW